MRPIEETIARWERWIDAVQRERDGHALMLLNRQSSDIQRAFSEVRLVKLDAELTEATERLAALEAQRQHPAMLLPYRPKPMLKVHLPTRERRRA